MKSIPLIKHLQEDAAAGAVAASAVAVNATPLFADMVRRSKQKKVKIHQYTTQPTQKRKLGIKELFVVNKNTPIQETSDSFDTTSVMAKLQDLEKKDDAELLPTTTFGLEDDTGNIVKVSVPVDQAKEFEHELQSALTTDDSSDIAELIFNLKDRFDIINVEWADIDEDEEEQQPEVVVGDDVGELLPTDNVGGEVPSGDDEAVSSLLAQVIDMMKADAEAKRAEAETRRAEAEAREAEAISLQAAAKVRQEEQLLDMDDYEKQEKAESKESKRLAKLAKWKHNLADKAGEEVNDMDDYIPSYDKVGTAVTAAITDEENEEYVKGNLANFILTRMGKK